MAVKARGRGAVAAVGLFLLLAGLVGGGVLYVLATQRPEQAVEGFARAPVGCTTTLEFTEQGTFYVFEETGSSDALVVECTQVATPGVELDAGFPGDLVPESAVADDSLSYDLAGFEGRSIRRIEIVETGQYEVAVVGDDLMKVAAIGRDPDEGVADLRRTALVLAIAGTVMGLLLLVVSGRRSRRAAEVSPPDGPGWPTGLPVSTETPTATPEPPIWPPQAPQLDHVPVSTPPAEPTPAAPSAAGGPWEAPSGDAADGLAPPVTDPVSPPPSRSTPSRPAPPPPPPPSTSQHDD